MKFFQDLALQGLEKLMEALNMTVVLLTRAMVENLNESCKNNERLGVILWCKGTYFTISVRKSQHRNQLKCGGPENTMRPISGSVEVSCVSCIHQDLCVWLFMQAFLQKTQLKHTFQRLSPWWTHVFLNFLERICRFCGKADIRILCIHETD